MIWCESLGGAGRDSRNPTKEDVMGVKGESEGESQYSTYDLK